MVRDDHPQTVAGAWLAIAARRKVLESRDRGPSGKLDLVGIIDATRHRIDFGPER